MEVERWAEQPAALRRQIIPACARAERTATYS
jgi:hypothetical protein